MSRPTRYAAPSSHTAIRAAVGGGAAFLAAESPVGEAFVEIAVWLVGQAGLPDAIVAPVETIVTAGVVAFGAALLGWLGSYLRDQKPEEPSTLGVAPRRLL